jgi:hypothetical protein
MKRLLRATVLLWSGLAFARGKGSPQVVLEAKTLEIGPGVKSADFGLNLGHIYANFPSDMAVGDRISGSIAVVPAGKTESEKSVNLAVLREIGIRVGDAQVSAASKIFVCPRVTANGLNVELRVNFEPIGRLFVEPKVDPPEGQSTLILPVAAVVPGRSSILGPFGGDLSQTQIRIGETPANVVVESPRSCVFDVPEGPIGPGRIEVRDGANAASGPFRIIGLHLTPPQPIIHTGDTTSFGAEVYGLDGLDHSLSLMLRNLSTSVVAMEGGEEQTLMIAPSQVSAGGTYAISRRLTGIHRGDYAVNVSVPWEKEPGTGKPDAAGQGSPIAGDTSSNANGGVATAEKGTPTADEIVRKLSTPSSIPSARPCRSPGTGLTVSGPLRVSFPIRPIRSARSIGRAARTRSGTRRRGAGSTRRPDRRCLTSSRNGGAAIVR